MEMERYHKISVRLHNRRELYFLSDEEKYVYDMWLTKAFLRICDTPIHSSYLNRKWKEALSSDKLLVSPVNFSTINEYLIGLI